MTANPERIARAERLRPFFELQLRLARRMAGLSGAPLSEMAVRHTNFHRRFGLGRLAGDPAPAWLPYAAALDRISDLQAQVALTHDVFLRAPDEVLPVPGRKGFGCFACDEAVAADGSVQIHFRNADTDAEGGPLAAAKLPRRRAEMAALVAHIRTTQPGASHIRGRSWLYNLAAYRRVFPPDYGASAESIGPEPVNLHGNSLWGQAIDSEERVRSDIRDAILAALPAMDATRPWAVFPLPVLATRAPLESFARFYGT
jgi:hypothetical protein